MKSHRRCRRGVSLMETVVATAISACILATTIGLYVKGTRGFFNEQGRSYMQSRTRTALDRMASDARGASGFLASATVGGVTYAASLGPNPAACIILVVPSQDSYGLMYYGAGTTTPNAPVNDTIIYYVNTADQTLRRTVAPAVNVVTNDVHSRRTSFRPAEHDVVVAHNVNQFRLILKDRDGQIVGANAGAKVASVDFQTQILTTGKGAGASPVSVTGVRLRNMRSGSIPGYVTRGGLPVGGAVVQAIYTGDSGPYPAGTMVGSATTDANGNSELYGLMEGTYSVTATPPSGGAATVANISVPQEAAAISVTVTLPPQA